MTINAYIAGKGIEPQLVHIPRRTMVSEQLKRVLPDLTPSTPTLFQAGTGAGKTTAILTELAPHAQETGKRILFISSRCAINLQFKRRLAEILGEDSILTDYSEEGLRKLEIIGPVTILTYHSLWKRMQANDPALKDVDFLVFDEIHALVMDAAFVPFTGELLKEIPRFFIGAVRIYMSATPEPILSNLILQEGSRKLTIYRWKADYSAYKFHFSAGWKDLIPHLKALPKSEKCLIFVSSIKEGDMLKTQLEDAQLITAKTRSENPECWSQLLSDPILPTRFTIATSTLDAGISLTDPDLHHIVCCGLDFAALVQQAGRKRLKPGEIINLYIFSPTRKQIGFRLQQALELHANLQLCDTAPSEFIERFILSDESPDIRRMCSLDSFLATKVDRCGVIISDSLRVQQFHANPLALALINNQIELYNALLKRKEERPFDTFICQKFGQKLPNDPSRWLDGRYDKNGQADLLRWLESQCGTPRTTKAEKDAFADEYRTLWRAAFGPRKGDRGDRTWGLAIIRDTLKELGWGYGMESKGSVWKLVENRAKLQTKMAEEGKNRD